VILKKTTLSVSDILKKLNDLTGRAILAQGEFDLQIRKIFK
jgi:hypothetical protein